ncbi:uncharacterized protein [Engystomops pustulosus]|uniref:uncharacterized protein isoform X2 n=1 Tax=Engystomops pustulosus TaxID=76066 RepID=UPI003AFAA855
MRKVEPAPFNVIWGRGLTLTSLPRTKGMASIGISNGVLVSDTGMEATPGQRIHSVERFNESWLNFCFHNTLLPGSPWHKVLIRVTTAFTENIKESLNNSKERQMIFKLLGNNFVKKHFSEYPNDPSLLHPQNISMVEQERLEKKLKLWLWDQWNKTSEQLGCTTDDGTAEVSPDMTSFVNHTLELAENAMDLCLAEQEAKDKSLFSEMNEEFVSRRSFLRKRTKSVESKDLHFAIGRTETFPLNSNDGVSGNQIKPPTLSSAGAEVLGNSICAIISLDASTMTSVCNRLNGHLLPRTLRRFIWMDKLLRSEKNLKGENITIIEKEARRFFGRKLEHRCAELKLRSATRCPISGLIENAVVEKFDNTPSMCPFATDEDMIQESSKSLNILYVYNGLYEPYLIHWLFPFQIAFRKTPTTDEHPYELFMYLHLLIKNIFPSWLEIFAMAERVMATLQTEDMELFNHLQHSFQRNVTFNPKDFLVELIAREREEALKLYSGNHKPQGLHNFYKEQLASPVIFLRKWMGEGFVNSLDLPAVLLIWDQLFMQSWNRNVIESFCLILLMLLKESIMAAENFSAIRQVFLKSGYHLLTADIQKAWIHLQQGGLLTDIPSMNRVRQRQVHDAFPRLQDLNKLARNITIHKHLDWDTDEETKSFNSIIPRYQPIPLYCLNRDMNSFNDQFQLVMRRQLTGTVSNENFRRILHFGVKEILLKILPRDHFSSNIFLEEYNDVKLTVSVHSGSMKLFFKTSSLKPILLEEINKNEALNRDLFLLKFNELFEFESIDLSDYTLYTESARKPFVLIKAFYSDGEQGMRTLGWAKIDAFEQDLRSSQFVWKPREFSSQLIFHLGKEPDNINECSSSISGLDSNDSSIEFTLYDPTKEIKSTMNHHMQESRKEEELLFMPAWVKHDESNKLPTPTTVQEPFILCIDALHYMPDCATIVKVSAKILNSGTQSVSEIITFPDVYSSARNPVFNVCKTISPGDGKQNVNTYVLFQVTTVDNQYGKVAVIGNCILCVFNKDGKLNVGGFQLKLRTGVPYKKLQSLNPPDLSTYPAFPCCTLLVRLLPNTEHLEPMANYISGYYFTDDAKPTRSELRIISTFQKDVLFPKSVKDMAEHLMKKEQSQAMPENQLKDWYEARLGDKSSLEEPSLVDCNTHNVVRYHQQSGLCVRIKQAFGLEANGVYVNAFARILKGTQSKELPELPQHWGGEEKLLTQQHDFTSLQRSPRWIDSSVVLHPYLDVNSVLLVQIFGMAATYIPHPSNDQCGQVISNNGQEINLQAPLGWTIFPLFDRQYVNSGIHSAPLFQGLPNAAFLQSVSVMSVKEAIKEGLKKKTISIAKGYGSATVELWDGHYFEEEHPALPVINDLLAVINIKKFLATQMSKKGKEMSMLIIESLDKKQRKLTRNSPEYQQHQRFYEEAMGEKFYDLIEMALLNAGYGPL